MEKLILFGYGILILMPFCMAVERATSSRLSRYFWYITGSMVMWVGVYGLFSKIN